MTRIVICRARLRLRRWLPYIFVTVLLFEAILARCGLPCRAPSQQPVSFLPGAHDRPCGQGFSSVVLAAPISPMILAERTNRAPHPAQNLHMLPFCLRATLTLGIAVMSVPGVLLLCRSGIKLASCPRGSSPRAGQTACPRRGSIPRKAQGGTCLWFRRQAPACGSFAPDRNRRRRQAGRGSIPVLRFF